MKKKLGLLVLAFALLVTSAVAGTLANEVEGIQSQSVDLTDGGEIENVVLSGADALPWVNEGGRLEPGIELTRNFAVKNTGTLTVYVRTWFAFEHDDYNCIDLQWGDGWTVTKSDKPLELNGVNYDVYYCDYENPLADHGAVTTPSLISVSMTDTADNGALSQFGDAYEIKVVSQAFTLPDDLNTPAQPNWS